MKIKMPDYDKEYLLFGTLLIIGNRLQALGDNLYEEITAKQWFVLCMLDVFGEEHPTLKELSEAMGSSHQNVKQLVLKLESKGYVTLEADAADKRKMRIATTSQMKIFEQKYGAKQHQFMKQIFSNMNSDEIACTLKTLLQMIENMEVME